MITLKDVMENQKEYKFTTDKFDFININVKDKKEKQAYVTGYISVPEVDLYDDIITPSAMKSMLNQINSSVITIDFEHEAWRDDNSILPVAKIIEAKIDDRGLWIKAVLNKSSPKFKDLWGSIKGGFINAFSIAFKPLMVVKKDIDGVEVRLIEELKLLNVAFTGAPVNEGAIMTSFSMKSIMLKSINEFGEEEQVLVPKSVLTKFMEEKDMEEEKKIEQPIVEEQPVEEVKKEEVVVEEKSEEEEKPKEDEKIVEEKALANEKLIAELKSMVEKQAEEAKTLAADLKSLKDTAVFKSLAPVKPEIKEQPVPDRNMLDLI